MRRQPGGEQAALGQRLVHQMQLELLQVAQAAVDQLAGSTGRAGSQVTSLDQGDLEPTGGGVEGGAGAGDPAADDQHVELLVTHPAGECGPWHTARRANRPHGKGRAAEATRPFLMHGWT
jgi:hypothetical protein